MCYRKNYIPIKKENSEFVLKSMENVRKFSVRPENIRKRSCFGTFSGRSILDKFRTNSGVSRKCLEFVRPENVPKRDHFRMFSGRTKNFWTFSILFRTNSEFSFFIGLVSKIFNLLLFMFSTLDVTAGQ